MDENGKGYAILARLSGEPEETLRRDPRALGRGLRALAEEALALTRGYASDDPATRDAARARWEELNAMLPRREAPERQGQPGLSERDRERLRGALSGIVGKLRELERETRPGRPDAPGGPDGADDDDPDGMDRRSRVSGRRGSASAAAGGRPAAAPRRDGRRPRPGR